MQVGGSTTIRFRRAGADRAAGPDGELLGAQLQSLQDATVDLARCRSLERMPAIAQAAARAGLGAEVHVVAVLDEEPRRLRALHLEGVRSGAPERLAAISLDGPSVIARAVGAGEPLFLESCADALLDARPPRMSRFARPADALAVLPLRGTESALGVIALSRPGERSFSDDDRAFLNVLAGLCALAVERLRLSAGRSNERAGLRRRLAVRSSGTQRTIGRVRLDLARLQIDVDGRSIGLTPSEFRVLMLLAEEPGRARTRREILEHVWQTEHVRGERACDAHIYNLRRKIERDPARPQLVVTRRGIGYALEVT